MPLRRHSFGISRRTRQSERCSITSGAITATARARGEPKFLAIDASEAIALKHPRYESEEIPPSIFNANPAWPTEKVETVILYSEHHDGDGHALFEAAARLNFEGIVSKRADAPYRSERTEAWQKIKTVQKGKFPVIGFVKDPTGVAALYLGKREGKDLVYMGKVGTGWTRTITSQIRKQLDTVVSPKSKLTKPVRKPKATWVEPSFVADVEFRDITSEGLLRQSSFKGLSKKER
jgi:ATP-dependent DNA ligase